MTFMKKINEYVFMKKIVEYFSSNEKIPLIKEYLLGKKNNAAIPGDEFHDEYCICYATDNTYRELFDKYVDHNSKGFETGAWFIETSNRLRLFVLKVDDIRKYIGRNLIVYRIPEEYNSIKEIQMAAVDGISINDLEKYEGL